MRRGSNIEYREDGRLCLLSQKLIVIITPLPQIKLLLFDHHGGGGETSVYEGATMDNTEADIKTDTDAKSTSIIDARHDPRSIMDAWLRHQDMALFIGTDNEQLCALVKRRCLRDIESFEEGGVASSECRADFCHFAANKTKQRQQRVSDSAAAANGFDMILYRGPPIQYSRPATNIAAKNLAMAARDPIHLAQEKGNETMQQGEKRAHGANGWSEWMERMDGANGWSEWMERMDGANGWSAWMECMDGVHGWSAWMECMDGVHGWSAWMECMDGVHGWSAWMECMDGAHGWTVINRTELYRHNNCLDSTP
ncbi:hypothetical protein ACRALDRAFT_210400 [Sodiomyces alcalophilus JCM 7366]|uniref:uncharacterized protein n=1 Tax=Sodiomyces alcalophilus JCM 7366 TaxID=591952 RepID=UPI0039B5A2D4